MDAQVLLAEVFERWRVWDRTMFFDASAEEEVFERSVDLTSTRIRRYVNLLPRCYYSCVIGWWWWRQAVYMYGNLLSCFTKPSLSRSFLSIDWMTYHCFFQRERETREIPYEQEKNNIAITQWISLLWSKMLSDLPEENERTTPTMICSSIDFTIDTPLLLWSASVSPSPPISMQVRKMRMS